MIEHPQCRQIYEVLDVYINSYLELKKKKLFIYFSGQFAVVKRVRELSTNLEFAAKFVRKKKCIAGKRGLKREEILREADILSELAPHENIITLHDVFENKHEIILVLELYVLDYSEYISKTNLSLELVLVNFFIILLKKMR
jgi:serine/threonine protein kinase